MKFIPLLLFIATLCAAQEHQNIDDTYYTVILESDTSVFRTSEWTQTIIRCDTCSFIEGDTTEWRVYAFEEWWIGYERETITNDTIHYQIIEAWIHTDKILVFFDEHVMKKFAEDNPYERSKKWMHTEYIQYCARKELYKYE